MSTSLIILEIIIVINIIKWIVKGPVSKIIDYLLYNEKQLIGLRKELIDLEFNLKSISAQDNFAKWAKLSRKIDSLKGNYNQLIQNNQMKKQKTNFIISSLLHVFVIFSNFLIWYCYSNVSILYLPLRLPWLLDWILRFQSAPEGSINVGIWIYICNFVISKVIH